ncbi:carboxymuconolactone decarboxylase family protein [Celeribacter marinus]|uniref:Macrophage infectivity potentiator-related protein n=1 Tax=Celeribacter marinus TaxID=1397108 RepID=A0A0P0A922_9RHOB|nr:carboxymuconolactone decarboxylase family protein [Celeribacter marinus]ALI54288.1 macrophage infectivity potentiator-related protein [Celeribacter marinus]SFK34328.1 alkylhydroperoxidase AhpD family core domain-containing protein [Celeribacter marinus]
MTDFTIHTIESAPDESKAGLETSFKAVGRVPGLHGVMAEAPALLAAYHFAHAQFLATSFDAEEKTVVWQSVNVEQDCHYCVPAHTGIAKMMKVDDAITEALRNETPLPTAKLEALRTFTVSVVRNRGFVDETETQAFLDAGYTQRHILEVILGVSQKVMSNYTNHFAQTPVDQVFEKFAWQKAGA